MPTIALSTRWPTTPDLAKLDTVKHFPPIRVWGPWDSSPRCGSSI
ncbi:MAG: hypothetical protein ACLRMJ_08090 [Alistipes finegoldii]